MIDDAIVRELESIPELKNAMQDPQKREDICNMSVEQLRNMAEMLYDGQVVHMEDAEEFIDTATPNDVDTWVDQRFTRKMMQQKAYKPPGDAEWIKWIPWVVMLMIGAAVAIQMVK